MEVVGYRWTAIDIKRRAQRDSAEKTSQIRPDGSTT